MPACVCHRSMQWIKGCMENTSDGSKRVPTIFVGKWTVKIMYTLKSGPQRHGQLRHGLRNISQRILTRTLRNLESTGLISRHVYDGKPMAVQYSLTKLGKTFIVPLSSICRWADGNNKAVVAAIRLHDKQHIEEEEW